MDDQIDLKDMWTSQEPLHTSNEKYWLKLRVLKDNKTQQKYYDILGGIKGKESHIHYGFDLIGNKIFDQPRNQIQKTRKTIDSALHGRISDDTEILKDSQPKINFILTINPHGASRESRVTRFEITSYSPP